MAIVHPQINPVALDLGMIELHWYGLMYLFAFLWWPIFFGMGAYQIPNRFYP